MAHYLLSVVTPTDGTPPARGARVIMKNVDTLHREMRDAGAWVFSGGLEAPDTATVVRPQGGELLLTDGPFAEAKEYLGGLSIVDAPDLDAALEWGRKVGAGDRRCPSRSDRSTGRDGARPGRRRAGLPRGVRPRRRRPGPPPRRHRPRRGGGAGGLRGGGAAVARGRAAALPRRLDRHDGPQPGDRPAPPRVVPRRPGTPRPPRCTSRTLRRRRVSCATTGSA